MLKRLNLLAPHNPPPMDLVPLVHYRKQFPYLVVAFVVDDRGPVQSVSYVEDVECYGLNVALSSHTRISKDVASGKITSATYERTPGRGGELQVTFKPDLTEVYSGQIRRGMAAWRTSEIESRYYQSIGLGRTQGGWHDFDVNVRLDFDGVTPSQWAEKAASDRAERAKKHNMYFLRCIDP